MKKIILLIVLIILIVLFATSCEKLKEGTIVDKFYEPKRTYTTTIWDVASSGPRQVTNTDDEDYVFIVSGQLKDGSSVRRRFEVSKNIYHKYEQGDFIRL